MNLPKRIFFIPIHNSLAYVILSLLWVIVTLFLINKYGLGISFDSHEYLLQADKLIHGKLPPPRFLLYLNYIGFIGLMKVFSDYQLLATVVFQVAYAAFAAFILYKTVFSMSGSVKASLLASALFITHIHIHTWDFFILTESLFISTLVISFYLFHINKYKWLFWILVLFIAFIRPTGVVVLLSYVVASSWNSRLIARNLTVMLISAIVVLAIFSVFIKSDQLLRIYNSGVIVYSAQSVDDPQLRDQMIVLPSSTLSNYNEGTMLMDLMKFVLNDPGYFFKLGFLKVGLYLTEYRPFNSPLHNAFNFLSLACFYFFSVYYFLRNSIKREGWFFLIVSFLFTAMIFVTYVSWEGRFFAPLIPFLIIYSTLGFLKFFRRFSANRS